jgi:hypothetical protein
MLASAFSAFAPSALPEAAAANANLYVSAENSAYQNQFGGPQVIEVVVNDPGLGDSTNAQPEPDVTLNGKDLRMVQTTDGSWHGFFADRTMTQTADQTIVDSGAHSRTGLDFGTLCTAASADEILDIAGNFTDVIAVAIPQTDIAGGTQGTTTIGTCTALTQAGTNITNNNVVREAKSLNVANTNGPGGVSLIGPYVWPFVQLYDFNPDENIVVNYAKSGGAQSVTINFNSGFSNFSTLTSDRSTYPTGSHVHLTITDPILNIDPTDEDTWVWGTNSTNSTGLATVYQPFDENGNNAPFTNPSSIGYTNIQSSLGSLNFETTGILKINYVAQGSATNILRIADTGDNNMTTTDGAGVAPTSTTLAEDVLLPNSGASGILGINTAPVTFTEYGSNSGIFGNYDNSDSSDLLITDTAPRGKSATVEYNEVGKSILVGFGFAVIDIQPSDAEWNSGEEIPVSLTDTDANKNSRADEDLDLNDPSRDLIPALTIGDPFTIGEAGNGGTSLAQAMFIANFSGSSTATPNFVNGQGAFIYTTPTVSTAHRATVDVQKFSERALLTANASAYGTALIIDTDVTVQELLNTIHNPNATTTPSNRFHGFNYLNVDLRSIVNSSSTVDVYMLNSSNTNGVLNFGAGPQINQGVGTTGITKIANAGGNQIFQLANYSGNVNQNLFTMNTGDKVGFLFNFTRTTVNTDVKPIVVDLFSFGFIGDGLTKANRVNNMIDRLELEETGDNTAVFAGSLEYIALNQLNILDSATYDGLDTIDNEATFIVHEDLDDEESPRVSYNDKGADGITTQVSDQEAAGMHSGVVSFDKSTYKKADTVVVTLEDQDLNTDSDLIDIYTVVNSTGDVADSVVGTAGLFSLTNGDALGRLLDITFDDRSWIDNSNACATDLRAIDSTFNSLYETGFTLQETGSETGIFTGDFQVPGKVCRPTDAQTGTTADAAPVNSQGLDMEVNYVDFRDASGQTIEVGDGAGIRANTGSVSFDRTVYPVPWGQLDNFASETSKTANGRSIFPVHLTAIGTSINSASETLADGELTIHVDVNDPDFDTSATGEDKIAEDTADVAVGPVKVTIARGADEVVLAYAGGPAAQTGIIDVGDNNATGTRELGPITETSPTSGIFEFDLDVLYTDGPASSSCPNTADGKYVPLTTTAALGTRDLRFDAAPASGDYCIIQGDIITVEYTDPADASGEPNTVTDSATFDLRNGALQSDKSVYIIGSDMILTLIEPDFDLDNDLAETYDLDLVEWDSDAATTTMGNLGITGAQAAFDSEPLDLRETGDST